MATKEKKKTDSLVNRLRPEFVGSSISRSINVEEIYLLSHEKLPNIIEKILSVREEEETLANIFLRRKGLEIYGSYKIRYCSGSLPIGILVCGAHLKKNETSLYLVTFRSSEEEIAKQIKPDLVDLLRDYII